jgi:hypothetical protein
MIGTVIAIGPITRVAAFLSLWQSTNNILVKGFVAHGAYTDKVLWIGALVLLVTNANRVDGLDATPRQHLPAGSRWFASRLKAPHCASSSRAQPGGTAATACTPDLEVDLTWETGHHRRQLSSPPQILGTIGCPTRPVPD